MVGECAGMWTFDESDDAVSAGVIAERAASAKSVVDGWNDDDGTPAYGRG